MIDTQAVRNEQENKAAQIVWQDAYDFTEPQWIAEADVGFNRMEW